MQLFPSKGQRDWKKFRLPVKRGDIMMGINISIVFPYKGNEYFVGKTANIKKI